ncbi:MAG TPA: DUF3330 domain-containing protein [Candidatus Tenderia electrophaga]|uniref:DUF3330 domain-containing protein n=1 Tax=Candidatus Tenderia electrophaga TaxID=1748243 RepID=A0A832J3V3_9GAMM|nr:DUF3330 domain-containing protein [Candidatus Tenderia electrophaga]
MSDVNKSEEGLVQCDVCLKEVPASESKSAEASDYVAHFCGLDCYAQWVKKAERNPTAD